MAYSPISNTVPQYHAAGVPASGYVLKAYIAGTSTLLQMATAADGLTLVNTVSLNSEGYPVVSGNTIIPHLNAAYKLALYPTQAAADANSGAIWTIDNLTPSIIVSNISISGNTISSTNTNGDITLDPNGSGEINLNATTNITTADIQTLQIDSVEVTPTAEELNQVDGLGLKLYITGFIPTLSVDTDHDLSFSSGACRNSADTISCKPTWTTLIKQIDAVFAEGTNAGGMATGAVANATAYYYNLIRKNADTAVFDICIDISASNANTPSGWTFMREIHREFTDGSANLQQQTYKEIAGGGVRCWLKTVIQSFVDNNPGTDLVTKTLAMPPSLLMHGTLYVVDTTSASQTEIVFNEVGSAATEPSASVGTLFVMTSATTAVSAACSEVSRYVDASRNVEYEMDQSTTDHNVTLQIMGWTNHRRV